jgi:FixJ family two-component response regulator
MLETAVETAERPLILLLEDDAAVRRSLLLLLVGSDFTVRSYATGAALLADPQAKDAAGLVIDYRLPDGNGLSVTRALRDAGFNGHAILITAFPSPELSAAARAEGFVRVFEKPLTHRLLVQAIAELSR